MLRRPEDERPVFAQGSQTEEAVRVTFLDALYDNLLTSQVASLLVAIGFVAFFEGNTDPGHLHGWLGYMLLVGAFRFVTLYRYRRAGPPLNRVFWERLFLFGVVLAGGGWGFAGVAFFDPSEVQQQILLTGAVAGVSAGAMSHLSPSPRASTLFLVLCVAPLDYAYLTSPQLGPGLGLLILLYLLTMLLVARRSHQALLENALLLHGNEQLVEQLTEHAEALERAKAEDEDEREMALSVFRAILPHSALAAANVTYHLSGQSAFNGDVLLMETRPDGRQNLMLGDFTGHGLAASLGAIPVADIFTAMTRKGFPLNVIATELNRKLYTHLPRNLFCAACLVEVDAARDRVRIWNGGLPSVYLLGNGDEARRRQVEAAHPPLGILEPAIFDGSVQTFRISSGDQVFMATDGVIEQRNAAGEMFGEQRLESILDAVSDIDALNEALRGALARFGEGAGQGDDITFVAVRATSEQAPVAVDLAPADEPDAAETPAEPDWSLHVAFQPLALRRVDPVPALNHLMRELTGASDEAAPFELVLGELYKNALDHGVLGLDSRQKATPDGFEAYYQRRDSQLANLDTGTVTVELANYPTSQGGVLEMVVSDSGEGFDFRALPEPDEGHQAHGRGVSLARTFCRDLEFLGRGNRVRARFGWRRTR